MEEVAADSPLVADDAVSHIVTPIVLGVGETDHQINDQINGDGAVATMIAADDSERPKHVESTKDVDDGAMDSTTPVLTSPSTRKKRGAFSLFRAMFVSFARSDTTDCTTSPRKKKAAMAAAGDEKNPAGGDSPTSWKSLVDGMRPLRLRGQELEYYPPPPPLGHVVADVYHDVLLPPTSPARSGFGLEEVAGMTSRYASAQDLQQMDTGGDEEDAPAGEGGDGGCCPHAIDMQAEEFIAKFYEQFKSESFNGRASE
ncbi:hypothetical protein HU200_005366 [Digitaria exilis]|uniref:Uncharacterized protein n=1 Tax=Digitaria exilis TaxID=1010633 RepID=A0A835FUH0_9POAL|nr:hypothetical protein HU200_005366 [Digitaria exilis]